MNLSALVCPLLLSGTSLLVQDAPSSAGAYPFDLGGSLRERIPLPRTAVPIDAIRFEAMLAKGKLPLRAAMEQSGRKVPAWKAVTEPSGSWLLSASESRFALRPGDEPYLLLTRTEQQQNKGSYVLLSRQHRYLDRLVFREGRDGHVSLPRRIPEEGRIVLEIRNGSKDLPLHEICLDLPPSWTRVQMSGHKHRIVKVGSSWLLHPPLAPGHASALYLDVEQKTKGASGSGNQVHAPKGTDSKGAGSKAEARVEKERLGFRAVFARSRLRLLRAPDPRGKRIAVQVVKKLPSTLTLPPMELTELRRGAFGEQVVLRADANYRFVEGAGVLSASRAKERVRPKLRAEGRELVFTVAKTGQERAWKLLNIKVQIQPDAFGLLQLYVLDGKTWLTHPFAELH